MFGLTVQGGLASFLAPDVCKVPAPPAGPVPVPLLNLFQLNMADTSTASQKVFFQGAQALNIQSKVPVSQGDEAGVAGGVVSGKFIGPGTFNQASGSFKVFLEGKKAVSMMAMTNHNGDSSFNTTGMCPMGAQTKVMVG
ncbi:MAG: DUF4150 domain-containing protein [Deltaproteobacteria bacterium]|jgi:hypothetical protein|nr:DUF4150 domain-containing protein [Deltaproteobacteria bacterium]